MKQKNEYITPIYATRQIAEPIPKHHLPLDEMEPRIAHAIIHDELMLDGNPRFNLATFLTTWMEPEAISLINDTISKNLIDKDEYPKTTEIEKRCIDIIANLFHSDLAKDACGCSTTGSSEAAMLAGIALKTNWENKMNQLGKQTSSPNLVMSIDAHICWEKFCKYFDVEARLIPMEKNTYTLDNSKAIELCDENTIGIIATLGTTFTGQFDDIEGLNKKLEKLAKDKHLDIPMHVDAASGGFIAPFIHPNLKWDFRLKHVKSINVSGHKYGLVYPGLGWIIWKDWNELPRELIFTVNYLGDEMQTFGISFSRPSFSVVSQYYNFLRLGFEGYKKIQKTCQSTALYLSEKIGQMKQFELISTGEEIPVFTWKARDNMDLYELSERLRANKWLIPAYNLPPNVENTVVNRIVVKEGFSRDMADMLINDIKTQLKKIEKRPEIRIVEKREPAKIHKIC